MQFNFKSLVVILDKIDSTGALPNCYDFDQVRNQNHHIPPLSIILQGSICLPGEVWGTKPGLGHVAVSSVCREIAVPFEVSVASLVVIVVVSRIVVGLVGLVAVEYLVSNVC